MMSGDEGIGILIKINIQVLLGDVNINSTTVLKISYLEIGMCVQYLAE